MGNSNRATERASEEESAQERGRATRRESRREKKEGEHPEQALYRIQQHVMLRKGWKVVQGMHDTSVRISRRRGCWENDGKPEMRG